MATVIERPEERERVVHVERSSDTGGWLIAVIILVAVVAGLIWWFRYQAPAAPTQQTTQEPATINVTIPTGNAGGEGSAPPEGSNGQ